MSAAATSPRDTADQVRTAIANFHGMRLKFAELEREKKAPHVEKQKKELPWLPYIFPVIDRRRTQK
jgi:hypothetical protein